MLEFLAVVPAPTGNTSRAPWSSSIRSGPRRIPWTLPELGLDSLRVFSNAQTAVSAPPRTHGWCAPPMSVLNVGLQHQRPPCRNARFDPAKLPGRSSVSERARRSYFRVSDAAFGTQFRSGGGMEPRGCFGTAECLVTSRTSQQLGKRTFVDDSFVRQACSGDEDSFEDTGSALVRWNAAVPGSWRSASSLVDLCRRRNFSSNTGVVEQAGDPRSHAGVRPSRARVPHCSDDRVVALRMVRVELVFCSGGSSRAVGNLEPEDTAIVAPLKAERLDYVSSPRTVGGRGSRCRAHLCFAHECTAVVLVSWYRTPPSGRAGSGRAVFGDVRTPGAIGPRS